MDGFQNKVWEEPFFEKWTYTVSTDDNKKTKAYSFYQPSN